MNSCRDRGICLNKAGVSTVSCGDDLPYCRATSGPPELLSWSLRPLMRPGFPPWSCPTTAPCALERDLSVCWRTSLTSQRKLNSRKHVCLLNKQGNIFLPVDPKRVPSYLWALVVTARQSLGPGHPQLCLHCPLSLILGHLWTTLSSSAVLDYQTRSKLGPGGSCQQTGAGGQAFPLTPPSSLGSGLAPPLLQRHPCHGQHLRHRGCAAGD